MNARMQRGLVMTSFDLTREPWIPCEGLDGAIHLLSSAQALARAHELRAIVDPSPLVVAVLHRHLLAILHRAYDGPASFTAWIAIANSGRFDAARTDAYLETWRHRFDLFHPETPFAQTRGLIQQFEATPIDELEYERSPWGGARELFQHRPEDDVSVFAPDRAARALLAHHAFATGGLVKKPGEPTSASAAPLTKSAVVLLTGASLFETLRANLLRYSPKDRLPIPASSDAPTWEQAPPPRTLAQAQEPKVMPSGWLHLLTWVSRRIELVADERGVTGFVRCVGVGFPEEAPRDPMVTYRKDEKRGFVPIGINPDRAFWRDASAFFQAANDTAEGDYQRPQAVAQASHREVSRVLGSDAKFAITLLGVATDQSRVEALKAESLVAHARLFDDAVSGLAVKNAVQRAEEGVTALRSALFLYARTALSPGDRSPDTKDIRNLSDSFNAAPSAWSALGVAFQSFLGALATDVEVAERTFADAAVRIARNEFVRATNRAETTAGWLKAHAVASAYLERELSPLVRAAKPPPPTPPSDTARTA